MASHDVTSTRPAPSAARWMDFVAELGAQVAERFPSFETAGLASSWTGVYDVTPDWNPVLSDAFPRCPG